MEWVCACMCSILFPEKPNYHIRMVGYVDVISTWFAYHISPSYPLNHLCAGLTTISSQMVDGWLFLPHIPHFPCISKVIFPWFPDLMLPARDPNLDQETPVIQYIYIYSILHNKSIELNPMKNSPQTSISLNSHEIPMNFVSNLSGPIKIPDFGHLLAHQLSGCAAA